MTKKQFIEKYADTTLQFQYYYKYEFTFVSLTEKITVCVGGDKDDIYRAGIDQEMKLKDLIHETGDEYVKVVIEGDYIEFDD